MCHFILEKINKQKIFKMIEERIEKKPGYLGGILNHKCPRCRKGNMFLDKGSYKLKSFLKMNEHCPECGQRTEIEPGFYYGTGYVSYVITVAFSISSLAAWWVLIGISVHDNRFFWWLGINTALMVLLQPWFMRISRTIWLSFFVKYNPNWRTGSP